MKKKTDRLLRFATRELTREKRRLFRMFCTLLVAGVLLFCGLLSLTALTVILSWETPYRIHTLTGVVILYLAGAAYAWRRVEVLDREGELALESTRAEFSKAIDSFGKAIDAQANAYPQSITMQLLTQQPGLIVFVVTELLPSILRKFYQRRDKQRRNNS